MSDPEDAETKNSDPSPSEPFRLSPRTMVFGLSIIFSLLVFFSRGHSDHGPPVDAAAIKARSIATQPEHISPEVAASLAANVSHDCDFVGSKTAFSIPLNSFSTPLAHNNNNGLPIAICLSSTNCKDISNHPWIDNKPAVTFAISSMKNGLPSCDETVVNCPDGESHCPLTAERATNAGIATFFGANFDFTAAKVPKKESTFAVRWNPVRNGNYGAFPLVRKYPQVMELAFKPTPESASYAVVCFGQVLVDGQNAPEDVYCMGDRSGCPSAKTCRVTYRKSVNQSGKAQFSLVPMGNDEVPENVFDK